MELVKFFMTMYAYAWIICFSLITLKWLYWRIEKDLNPKMYTEKQAKEMVQEAVEKTERSFSETLKRLLKAASLKGD